MSKLEKAALILGGVTLVGGILYLAAKVMAVAKKYLTISVGPGGTTDPAPGRYLFRVGESVKIHAIPDSGYTVGTWVVDGVEVAREIEELTVTMDADHNVIVTFWEGGAPPPTYPVSLQSLGSVNIKQNIGAWFTGKTGVDQCCHIAECDENWNIGDLVLVPIRFKAVDAAGRGVPNVDVALWTDPMPDTGRYKGYLLLEGAIHTIQNPLIVKTDVNGVASARLSYRYGLNDKYSQIADDAGVGFQFGCGILPCVMSLPAKDDYCLLWTCYVCWTFGECETGKAGCEKMGGWQLNRVYAQIVGTAISTTEFAYCGFHMKWL